LIIVMEMKQAIVNSPIGQRAVIIGAGIGGLSGAAALSPYFAEIVLLERDRQSAPN
jgi:glycine/D-amino acid oxidase-like deaminating enzyme